MKIPTYGSYIVLEIHFLEILLILKLISKKLTPFLFLVGKSGICTIWEDKYHKLHNDLCP